MFALAGPFEGIMVDLQEGDIPGVQANFEAVELTDPFSGESMHLSEYMMAMAGAFAGVRNDLWQGQVDAARQNFQVFSGSFNNLTENACKQCHKDQTGKEIPRTYFVDDSVMGMTDQLGQAVAANPPNGQAIEQFSDAIGGKSCMKCHLVHFPAATAKHRWEILADAFK
jgi:hypothetical protein